MHKQPKMTKFIGKSHFSLITLKYILQHKTAVMSLKYDRNLHSKQIISSFLSCYIILHKDANLTITRFELQFVFFHFLYFYASLFAEKNTFLTNNTYHPTYPVLRINSLKCNGLKTKLTSENITF